MCLQTKKKNENSRNLTKHAFSFFSFSQIFFSFSIQKQELAKKFLEENENFNSYTQELTPALVDQIKKLWADSGVQKAYSRRNEIQLIDSAE